jgi:hypothetical protein
MALSLPPSEAIAEENPPDGGDAGVEEEGVEEEGVEEEGVEEEGVDDADVANGDREEDEEKADPFSRFPELSEAGSPAADSSTRDSSCVMETWDCAPALRWGWQ